MSDQKKDTPTTSVIASMLKKSTTPLQRRVVDLTIASKPHHAAIEIRCACGRLCPDDRTFCCKECPRGHRNSCNRRTRDEEHSKAQPGRYRTLLSTGRAVKYKLFTNRDGFGQVTKRFHALNIETSKGRVITLEYPDRDAALRAKRLFIVELSRAISDAGYDAFIDAVDRSVKSRLGIDGGETTEETA